MSNIPRRALILIDVQNEYFTGGLRIEYPDPVVSLANIERAAAAAQQAGIPIVVVQHSAPVGYPIFAKGSPGWQLHPSVAALAASHYVEKRLPSSFAGTDLGAWLRSQEIDTLTVAGYMTHNCNDATIRQAVHEGWAVEYLHDASGSVPYVNQAGQCSAETIHKTYLVVLQSFFAAVLATDEWIAGLASGTLPVRDNIYLSNQRAKASG